MSGNLQKFKAHFKEHYYSEISAAKMLCLVSLLSLFLPLLGIFVKGGELYYGLAASMVPFGLAQLLKSIIDFLKAKKLIESSKGQMAYTPKKLIQNEVNKINSLNEKLHIFKRFIYLPLFMGFVISFLYMSNYGRLFTLGVGIGLIIQGAVCLVLHLMMHWRVGIYTHHLHQVNDKYF